MKILIDYAMSMVGKPYIWGGDDPMRGFDCSGLAQEILSSVGLDPNGDQTSQALHDFFKQSGRRLQSPQAGALVFYGSGESGITHIAMALDHFRVVEAGGGGSKTVDEKAAIDQNAYVRVRPWNKRSDVVAIYLPDYKSKGVA